MAVVPYCCSFAGASRCSAELRTAGPAPTCPLRQGPAALSRLREGSVSAF